MGAKEDTSVVKSIDFHLSVYLLLILHFFFHALLCCVSHAVLLSYTPPHLSSLPHTHTHIYTYTHTHTHSLLHTPPSPFVFKCLEHSDCLPPPPPPPDCLFICHLCFLSLPCFSPFLLSVSIGGHGLGKPSERLCHVEELLFLFFLTRFCQHGGWWHQLST